MMSYVRKFGGLGASSVNPVAVGEAAGNTAITGLVLAGAVAGPVGAVISAGIAAVGMAIEAIMNSGCGQTCIVSTQFANQANAALQQNIEAYFALPTPRSTVDQQAALANFDKFWAWLQQPSQCGNPNLGAAGQRCITDRQAGACTWKQPASSVPPWGTPPAGACWNWFSGYRQPIADDPDVYTPSAVSTISAGTPSSGVTIPGTTTSVPWPVLGLAGAGLLLFWALES